LSLENVTNLPKQCFKLSLAPALLKGYKLALNIEMGKHSSLLSSSLLMKKIS
jgi:hypothetical protein